MPFLESRPDYGIDAPGIRRGLLIAGGAGLTVAVLTNLVGLPPRLALWMSALGAFIAVYGLFMGGYMTYGSRIGKLRAREVLLDLVSTLRPWTGNEMALDVGCGRGLMMVGAARRLTVGRSIGIDLWREEDQSGNSPEEARANADAEGVADRVQIDTGDARKLPYPNASFDVVMSHWVVHNLPTKADQLRALDEMFRVLRPGGVLALADIGNLADYQAHLLSKGASNLRFLDGGAEAAIMGALSGGTYRPQALLAQRP